MENSDNNKDIQTAKYSYINKLLEDGIGDINNIPLQTKNFTDNYASALMKAPIYSMNSEGADTAPNVTGARSLAENVRSANLGSRVGNQR